MFNLHKDSSYRYLLLLFDFPQAIQTRHGTLFTYFRHLIFYTVITHYPLNVLIIGRPLFVLNIF